MTSRIFQNGSQRKQMIFSRLKGLYQIISMFPRGYCFCVLSWRQTRATVIAGPRSSGSQRLSNVSRSQDSDEMSSKKALVAALVLCSILRAHSFVPTHCPLLPRPTPTHHQQRIDPLHLKKGGKKKKKVKGNTITVNKNAYRRFEGGSCSAA